MIAFLVIISAIALLTLIVYALHKFQQKEKEESVDRNSPLPPLPLHQTLDDAVSDKDRPSADKDWQLLVKELKEGGQIRQALDVCMAAYPQMGAFKQACVLLRAEVRDARRRGASPQESLAELYRVSAMAALFHEKVPGTPVIPANVLKNIKYADFRHLLMPYKDLGYAHLKLLTPTDLKIMDEIWGAPNNHRHVREFHEAAWSQVLAHLQNQTGTP
ncbi:MAG: hypothetical protein WBJ75_10820 [Pseudohongiellaceae bacterium]